jgi:hypothetical protein
MDSYIEFLSKKGIIYLKELILNFVLPEYEKNNLSIFLPN